ncbi:bifunctional (p)ppGpp synthetase/guanosine-3',5'-bis(diphosphate) 3'-pyrophosphohydrolase [Candidatus Micrarchaeota archaeon]|nr:bifunctional (p)ppGpp synthetase/guanosine-3',5'-bis(diphosphate) 3'-pyrophosphohydrolase [Candidatus Micrarchaeota archaeon]
MSKITSAFELAYKAHKKQKRKGTNIPYIVHPMEVAIILMKNNASEELIAAGLLHDVVEDTDVELSEIERKFGKKIALLVRGATEPEKLTKKKINAKKSWKQRKLHTIEFIRNANREMKMLSCGDKLSNIRSSLYEYDLIGDELWKRFNASKEQQMWYYYSMLKSFSSGSSIVDLQMYKDFKKCVEQLFGK